MEIVLATNNQHKVEELRALLPGHRIYALRDIDVDIDIEENGATLEENALIKARAVRQHTKKAVIADDTGLFVRALDGEPGIYSARYAGENATFTDNNEKLLDALTHASDRSATFVCAIAVLVPGYEDTVILGKAPGAIANTYIGDGGFGYDPIFIESTTGKTYAQMSPDEKNAVSHRALAVKKVRTYLSGIESDGENTLKLLVVSDTHNRFEKLHDVVMRHKDVDGLIHLGDGLKEAYDVASLHDMPLYCVRGNNDHYHNDPREKVLTLGGQTLFLTHGHEYFVGRTMEMLLSRTKEKKAAAVLYGHTHRPHNEVFEGVLLFNPGSLATPRGQNVASYGILTLSRDGIHSEILPR